MALFNISHYSYVNNDANLEEYNDEGSDHLPDDPMDDDENESDDASDIVSVTEAPDDSEDEDEDYLMDLDDDEIDTDESEFAVQAISDHAKEEIPDKRVWKPNKRILESPLYCKLSIFLANLENLTIKESIERYGKEATEEAIRAELLNMESRDVWEAVNANETFGKNVVPSQLFLKPKFDANGKFIKLKARLVACGNRERFPEGFNSTDIESPTPSFSFILTLLQLAIIDKRKIAISDVTAAYLHANIDGEVYMRLNKDISNLIDNNSTAKTHVKLKKCLYGLRQSGRRWYELLASTLKTLGFKISDIEPCAFFKDNCWIITYVDDIIIMSTSEQVESSIITALEKPFGKLQTQYGPSYSFLGLSMCREEHGLLINQSGYLDKITSEVSVSNTKYPHRNKPTDSDNEEIVSDETRRAYKSLIMKIMFLATRTRPDVMYNTAILATKNNPTKRDFQDGQRILSYLKATRNKSIMLTDKPLDIQVFCDAAFNVHNDRKSQTGYTIHMNNSSGPIMYKSKKQTTLAQSSTEAEIIALFEANRQLTLILQLIAETGTNTNSPITVYEDNQAVIEIINSRKILRGNAKFIDRKYLQTREHVLNGTIKLQYVRTENQIADSLTKALTGARFNQFTNSLFGGTSEIENKTNIDIQSPYNIDQEKDNVEDA